MIKISTWAIILIAALYWCPASSKDVEQAKPSAEDVAKWDAIKTKVLFGEICSALWDAVNKPTNPSYASTYEARASTLKQFIVPLMVGVRGVPYKERSLEHIPIPDIESLDCKQTVEKWRAMYEYKTIPYKEVVRSPFSEFLDDVFDWVGKIFDYIFLTAIAIAVVIISLFMFYGAIKSTRKDNPAKLHHFTLALFISSVFAIAPLYFVWTLWSHDGSFVTYFIGCLIYTAVMIFISLIRKYR